MNNLWQVGGGGLTDPSDAAIYLVRFGDRAAMVDAVNHHSGSCRFKQISDASTDTPGRGPISESAHWYAPLVGLQNLQPQLLEERHYVHVFVHISIKESDV